MYIDYLYYVNNSSDIIPDAAFARCEFRARKIVDKHTFGRVKRMAVVPEAVRRLMVELVTLESTQGGSIKDNPALSSFSNDGYSETIADPLTAETVKQIEEELIHEYLCDEVDDEGTPLLYMGVV